LKEKTIYIISGCNGAGKTTASLTILPEILDCKEFVNADNIAFGLSPFQPEKVAFEAGRIMLEPLIPYLKEMKILLSKLHYQPNPINIDCSKPKKMVIP